MLRRLTTLCVVAGIAAVPLAGCGSDDSSDGGIASIAPQDTSLFFEATIRPEGDEKTAVDGFLSKLLGDDDPGAKIEQLVDDGFASEGENRTYAKDVEPWLGDTAAVFTVGFGNDSPSSSDIPAVVAVSSDDPDAGLDLIRSESTDVTDVSHDGTDYQLDEDGQAFGEINGFIAFGDETAYKAAIDASGGDSLEDAGDFVDSESNVPDEAIASAYLNMDELAKAVSASEGVPPDVINSFLDTAVGDGPIVGWVTPNSDSLELALSAGESALTGTGGGDLLASLPADAWLALDLGDLGEVVDNVLDQSDEIIGFSRETLVAQVRSRTGIDLDRDVLSWLGESAIFVSGTDSSDIGGALVVRSTDSAASARGLSALQRAAGRNLSGGSQVRPLGGGAAGFEITEPGTPQPLQVFQDGDEVVIAYGQKAADTAVGSGDSLGDTDALKQATDDLGDKNASLFLDFPTVLQIAESMGAGSGPGYDEAKPYLQAISYVVAASGTEGGRSVFRALVGVK